MPHRPLSRLSTENLDEAISTRFVFFTGKGGVGKTSIACATAVAAARRGKRVLLVSTDPASNLDETLGIKLTNKPSAVPQLPLLKALNINPETAAHEYRERVIAPLVGNTSAEEIEGLREQLSGACTTEIAAFDEFSQLISEPAIMAEFDLVLFDTAPTGHTIRLLSLPQAWTGFFDVNERGASCLGPHTALKSEEERFTSALGTLTNPNETSVVLVARPEKAALAEAGRTLEELRTLKMTRHLLVINGVFVATSDDPFARALQQKAQTLIETLPSNLSQLPCYFIPLMPFNTVGLEALQKLLDPTEPNQSDSQPREKKRVESIANFALRTLAEELAAHESGLVLVMGKGGVGKTTVAAALAVSIAELGAKVHLSTTDPAAHLAQTLEGRVENLTVSRIDPRAETAAYIEKIIASKGPMSDDELEMLKEDLASPCTEEVAVFHAFSRTVFEARRGIVILDTAPTGHTLLLLDAAGSYHREMLKKFSDSSHGKLRTPLMMLQDATTSKILIVTLPETTPISEASALQDDLKRVGIEPYAWVVNRSLLNCETSDPILLERLAREVGELERIKNGLAKRVAVLPLTVEEPVGAERLRALVT